MITLALIGAGKWGKNYLKTVTQLKDVQIKYTCTRHSSPLEEILKQSDIDGFILATPAATHYQIVKTLLQQGNNVLIEKPLTLNSEQSEELCTLWQKQPSVVLVGHTQLFNPAYQKCKELLGQIGDIKKITFKGLRSPPRSDTSILWDWGPHPASILLDLHDNPIKKITTRASNILNINIIYTDKVEAQIMIGWDYPKKVRMLTIKGTKGTIYLDDAKQEHKISLEYSDGRNVNPEYDKTPPLQNELSYFVNAINGSEIITSDIFFGAQVVELLSAIDSTFDDRTV